MPGDGKRAYGGFLEHWIEVKIGYAGCNLDAERGSVHTFG